MRPYSELADIVLQLKNVEKIKRFLQSALETVDVVSKEGELWIEEKSTPTFTEMKQNIVGKTLEVLQSCFSFTKSQLHKLTDLAHVTELEFQSDEQTFIMDADAATPASKGIFKDRKSTSFSPSHKIKKQQRKLDEQQLQIERIEQNSHRCEQENNKNIEELQKNVDEKFACFKEEFIKELEAASSFMTNLNTKYDTLSKEIEKNNIPNKEQDTKIDVRNEIGKLLKDHDDFKESLEDLAKRQTFLETERIQLTQKDWEKMSEDLAKVSQKVTSMFKELITVKRGAEGNTKISISEIGIAEENSDFLCQAICQSDVKCSEGCFHILGQHEQQILPCGEEDRYRYLQKCKKNPVHINLIPIHLLSCDDLPQKHRDKNLYDLIKCVADLTVKIDVYTTSPNRPLFWPNSKVPYYLYNLKLSWYLRTGNGFVSKVEDGTIGTCPCVECKHADKPNKDCWKIQITSAASLVFDEIEAKHTTVRLFYDEETSVNISFKIIANSLRQDISNDQCSFYFLTCDKNFAEKMKNIVTRYVHLREQINEKYKENRDKEKFMFIVSHPHGYRKHVSFGSWKNRYTVRKTCNKLTYLTCTCPGSTGGSVYLGGYGMTLHSGSLQSGLNYSTNCPSFH